MDIPETPAFRVKPLKRTKKEREKAKLLELIINHYYESVPGFKDELHRKVREQLLHEMTCTDYNHNHDIPYVEWKRGE